MAVKKGNCGGMSPLWMVAHGLIAHACLWSPGVREKSGHLSPAITIHGLLLVAAACWPATGFWSRLIPVAAAGLGTALLPGKNSVVTLSRLIAWLFQLGGLLGMGLGSPDVSNFALFTVGTLGLMGAFPWCFLDRDRTVHAPAIFCTFALHSSYALLLLIRSPLPFHPPLAIGILALTAACRLALHYGEVYFWRFLENFGSMLFHLSLVLAWMVPPLRPTAAATIFCHLLAMDVASICTQGKDRILIHDWRGLFRENRPLAAILALVVLGYLFSPIFFAVLGLIPLLQFLHLRVVIGALGVLSILSLHSLGRWPMAMLRSNLAGGASDRRRKIVLSPRDLGLCGIPLGIFLCLTVYFWF
jgi:hypothetical protein